MSSDHYTPNGGNNTSGQGWEYSSGSGKQPPKKPQFNLREWIPIFILFCIPSGVTQLIAFIWALSKVADLIKANKEYQAALKRFGRNAAEATRDAAQAVRSEVVKARETAAAQAEAKKQAAEKAAQTAAKTYSYTGSGQPRSYNGKKIRGGTALVVLGIIFGSSLGFSTLMCLVNYVPVGAFTLGILTLASLFMLGGGIKLNRRKERMLNYLAYIGTNREVGLVNMALSFGISIKKLCSLLPII